MDFSWTSEDEAYRKRIREVLAKNLPKDWTAISRHGPGSREQTAFSLAFCPRLATEGLLVPHWPVEWGGAEHSAWQQLILAEEMWAAGEPRGAQYMNVNWIGPTIMRFGSEAQKRQYLPEMAAGRGIWCQGFSEPSSGSDLASLRSRAERAGSAYIINGSKIWTSYAAFADHCFLLARVGPQSLGKAGIAIFLISMATPGITVRPIPSLIGEGDIHEVFFTDVTVPASCRLGEEEQAWAIISYALANERVGIARWEFSSRVLSGMVDELKTQGRFEDPVVKARAGQAAAACEAARILVYKLVDQKARGVPSTADASLARVAVVTADHAVTDFGLDFLPGTFCGAAFDLHLSHHERAIASGIASGAAEIQLNIVAQGHLGLPREPRR